MCSQFSGLSEVGMPYLEHIPTLIQFNSILKLLDCTELLRTPFSAAPDFKLHRHLHPPTLQCFVTIQEGGWVG